jgi:hypothetical protein
MAREHEARAAPVSDRRIAAAAAYATAQACEPSRNEVDIERFAEEIKKSESAIIDFSRQG